MQPKNPSGSHLDFRVRIKELTKTVKRKPDVGEPWLTPTVVVIITEPSMPCEDLYIIIIDGT